MTASDKMKVLIVEDSPETLMLVASVLSRHGYALLLARSGAEALECAAGNIPDVVLFDIVMPEMNGLEVCRRFKEIPGCSDVPVIFLTGLTAQEEVLKGFKAGAVDYISKPFNHEELFRRVDVHAQRYRLQLQLQRRNEALVHEIELRRKRELQLCGIAKTMVAGRISAGISHHFNNMFQTILGYSELIESCCKAESEIIHYARQIVAVTEKTSQIVNKLSNYLSDSRESEPATISLKEVFLEVEVAFTAILPKDVVLTFSASRNCPDICFNRDDVIQVMTNVIMNSIDAIPDSGGQIGVRATPVRGQDNLEYVELSVADNGMGMGKDVLARACEPFFTTNDSFSEKNGLGLSVAQNIMHASNGSISIESEVGSGTLVRLLFPLARRS